MPEIDNDLFKVLVVALLAITSLLLLGLLAGLSGVRKLLKQQLDETRDLRDDVASGLTSAPAQAAAPEAEPPEQRDEEAAVGGQALVGGAAAAAAATLGSTSAPERKPEPISEPSRPAPEPDEEHPAAGVTAPDASPEDPFATPAQPSAEDPFAASAPSSSTDEAAGAPSGTEDAFAESTPGDERAEDPFATTAPGDERTGAEDSFAATSSTSDDNPFMTDADQPAAQATFDEPEDQPFERNGRWYFRRDDELLVYQEGTGEWVPADPADLEPPAPPRSDYSSSEFAGQDAAPAEGAAGDSGVGQPEDTARFETIDQEPRPAAGGGFWKCPSCGAVNGSSATTCRMCFSARP